MANRVSKPKKSVSQLVLEMKHLIMLMILQQSTIYLMLIIIYELRHIGKIIKNIKEVLTKVSISSLTFPT